MPWLLFFWEPVLTFARYDRRDIHFSELQWHSYQFFWWWTRIVLILDMFHLGSICSYIFDLWKSFNRKKNEKNERWKVTIILQKKKKNRKKRKRQVPIKKRWNLEKNPLRHRKKNMAKIYGDVIWKNSEKSLCSWSICALDSTLARRLYFPISRRA